MNKFELAELGLINITIPVTPPKIKH